jgi:chromosome segregation ATPase
MRTSSLKFLLLTLCLAAAGQQAAYADATTEAQLRSALQAATTQIATLEDQVANLQASEAPNVAMIEALRAQLQTLQGGGKPGGNGNSAGEAKNDAALKALTRQLAVRNAELGKSQAAYEAEAGAATTAATENAALKAQLATASAGLASCNTKNAQLFDLGNQILDAYSHKDDVFGVIADHEPFIGYKRVQLQSIVQDDQDKLYDNQIVRPGTGP